VITTGTMEVALEIPDYKPKKLLLWFRPATIEEAQLLLACEGKPLKLERRGNAFVIEVTAEGQP